jgi:hypothetical protein
VFAPDEIFQTLEPAHRLAFGEGIVTWEYRSGARSWIVPALLAVLAYLGDQVSSTPSGYLAMVRVALCALSLIPVAVALLWGWRRGGVPLALLAGGICAFWFDLLFFAPKALNEVFGAHLLLLGLWLGLDARGPADGRRLGTAAAICAAAACIRLQLAPAVVVALFGIGWPARRRDALVLGALAPVVLFGLVDWLTWGAPFHSYWENYYANVIDGRSHLYGWLPKYQYLLFVWHAWLGPTAVAMVVLAAVGAARERLLACVALAIVVPHSFLGHKEYRYLYSAIPFGLLLVARGAHLVALRLGGGPASTLRWAMGSLGAGMLASLLAALDFTEDKVPTGMAAQ